MSLTRRRDTRDYTIREASPPEAGAVLRRYVRISPSTRPYFQAAKNSPVEDFIIEAHRHPCSSSYQLARIATADTLPADGADVAWYGTWSG